MWSLHKIERGIGMKKICCLLLLVAFALSMFSAYASETLTPEWLADEFSNIGTGGYLSKAEYVEQGDYFLFSLQDTAVNAANWKMFSSSIKKQLTGAFESIVSQIDTALDGIGCTDTTLICTYQLVDGQAVVLLIDGEDHSEFVS